MRWILRSGGFGGCDVTCHGVQNLRIASLLEILQGLAAHGGVDMQIGGAQDRPEFLEQEEDHSVVDEGTPVALAQHVALFGRELRFFEQYFGFGEEACAHLRLNQLMQKM